MYVNQIEKSALQPLTDYQQSILKFARKDRKRRDKLCSDLEVMKRNINDYHSDDFQTKKDEIHTAKTKADMSNRQIVCDNVLGYTIEEFLKAKYEYHKNVLLEISHMQKLLEEARPDPEEEFFEEDEGKVACSTE